MKTPLLTREEGTASRRNEWAPAGRPGGTSRHYGFGSRLFVGIILVGFVLLVTVVFSFAGTITSCVLLGMMMGSLRSSLGTAISVSAIFPLVTVALLQYPAPAVTLPKAITLAGLCFLVFWVMFALTRGLMLLESGGQSKSPPAVGNSRAPAVNNLEENRKARNNNETPRMPELPPAVQDRGDPQDAALALLQGRWISHHPGDNGNSCTDVIEFRRRTLEMARTDACGNLHTRTEGIVKCETLGPFKTIKVFDVTTRSPASAALSRDGEQTWLYRLDGETLTLVTQLDHDGSPEPVVGIYRRDADALEAPGT